MNTEKTAVTDSRKAAGELAERFGEMIQSWLTKEEIALVNERNARPEYKGCCASHDFCDANEAMNEAFKAMFGRDIDCEDGMDCSLCNKAWDKAKNNFFRKV